MKRYINETYQSDTYFLNDDFADCNSDNFIAEDGEHYYYLDGTPFAFINGKFYVGDFGEMHSDCSAKAAYDDFCQNSEEELDELRGEEEDLQEQISNADEDEDTSDLEEDLEYVQNRIEEIEDLVYNDDYKEYFNEHLDSNEREDWVQMLDSPGRFWRDGNSGVIACWSTPSTNGLENIVQLLNAWAKKMGRLDWTLIISKLQ